MPRINSENLVDRISKLIQELEAGDEVTDNRIRSVLNATQRNTLDSALDRDNEDKALTQDAYLGHNPDVENFSQRDVKLGILKVALRQAEDNAPSALMEKMRQAQVLQARLYFDTPGDKQED